MAGTHKEERGGRHPGVGGGDGPPEGQPQPAGTFAVPRFQESVKTTSDPECKRTGSCSPEDCSWAFGNYQSRLFYCLVRQSRVRAVSGRSLWRLPGAAGAAGAAGARASRGAPSRPGPPTPGRQPRSPAPLSSRRAGWWGELEAAVAAAAAASFSFCLSAAAFFSCSAWLFMWALRLFTL